MIVRIEPPLHAATVIFGIALTAVLALAMCSEGMKAAVHQDEINENNASIALHRCLDGITMRVHDVSCHGIAQYIIRSANAAEREFSKGEGI